MTEIIIKAPRKPKDERDILNLKKPDVAPPEVQERETIRSDGSSGALEKIGKAFEGIDGKRYLGSMAVHIFRIDRMLGQSEHVYMYQSTDLREIPETVAATALPEMGRAIMTRYGRKPPASTLDKNIKKSDGKV